MVRTCGLRIDVLAIGGCMANRKRTSIVWTIEKEKLREIVDDLGTMDETEFASARTAVRGIAALAREREAHSKQHGQAGTAG